MRHRQLEMEKTEREKVEKKEFERRSDGKRKCISLTVKTKFLC